MYRDPLAGPSVVCKSAQGKPWHGPSGAQGMER